MYNLGALAVFDEKKLPDIKQFGESIIREFWQVMLKEWSTQERAAIPDDLAQKLLVGVCVHFTKFQPINLQLYNLFKNVSVYFHYYYSLFTGYQADGTY